MSESDVDRVALDPYTFGAEQQCFGCGPNNPHGLKLRFAVEGDSVVTTFTPSTGLDGPPGIFHGGLQATLCDEVAGWGLVGLLGRMGFTTSMKVRYMRPVRLGTPVEARAKIASQKGDIVTMKVTLSQAGKVGCMARVSYVLPTVEAAENTMQRPMDPTWIPLFSDQGDTDA
jgi:acyl-coenzyme A thioesterase PaaI-like protein